MANLKYSLLHFAFILLLYVIFAFITGHNIFIAQNNLQNWDVLHYISVINEGYNFNPLYQSNVAFFPGFPLLWKFLHLNTFGIILLNIFMFYGGLLLLGKYFKFSIKELLLSLSIPGMFFMYVPYSEALFFICSAILLIGLWKGDQRLVILGLFACSFTRSAANIFLPAIIIMEIISSGKHNRWLSIALYSGASLAGIFLVALIQYIQTGVGFGFLQTQKHWGHGLQLPVLPFTTWGDVLRLDAAAMAVGAFAAGTVLFFIYRFISKKEQVQNKAFLFSALYLAGLAAFALLFKGGSIFSVNRYLLSTSFVVVFTVYFLREFKFTKLQYFLIFIGLTLFWQLCNSFAHISLLLKFLLVTLYFFAFLFVKHENKLLRNTAFTGAYIFGSVLQVILFFEFLDCKWVG